MFRVTGAELAPNWFKGVLVVSATDPKRDSS